MIWRCMILAFMTMSLLCLQMGLGRQEFQTVAIVSTSDIHGYGFPEVLNRPDTEETYTRGGLAYMARLIEILHNEHADRMVFVNSGDDFTGGFESSKEVSKGGIIKDFFNTMKLQATVLGNHEFDYGEQFLAEYMEGKEGQLLDANVGSENGGKVHPSQESSRIFEVGDVKIGLIGLSTVESSTSSGFAKKLFPPYKFHPYKQIVVREAASLREKGADAIVVFGHLGNRCSQNLTYDIRTNATSQPQCQHDEIMNLIDSVPAKTFDAFLGSHRHQHLHHYYHNIPMAAADFHGYSFYVLYLRFRNQELYDTAIEGPIPVCERVFANTHDCQSYNMEEAEKAGPLVGWTFHGRPVYSHHALNSLYQQKWVPLLEPYEKALFRTEVRLESSENENPLLNMISSMLMEAGKSDFCWLEKGNAQTIWYEGDVNWMQFYQMFPNGNHLMTFSIKGDELRKMLDDVIPRSHFHFAGLTQYFSHHERHKQFLYARFSNGEPIIDDAVYRGAMFDVFLNGGYFFQNAINEIYTPREVEDVGMEKDILLPQLVKMEIIKASDWFDRSNRRIIYQ